MTQKAVTPDAWRIPADEGFSGDMASVTAKHARDAAIIPAMIHIRTIGRHKRRCGRFLSSGEG
jgi:hypothetical protein